MINIVILFYDTTYEETKSNAWDNTECSLINMACPPDGDHYKYESEEISDKPPYAHKRGSCASVPIFGTCAGWKKNVCTLRDK